jgi:RNA polymerase sigma-70 factor, ECF subfamily
MQIGHTSSNASSRTSTVDARSTSDNALIQAIADGDRPAFEILYVRHHARVLRFVMRIVGNEATAEDVIHEVFLEAWRQAGKFEGKSQVATWLLGIARFKAIGEFRRRPDAEINEDASAAIEDPADTPSTTMDKKERSAVLRSCLSKLTPHHREVINLIYYQGKKIEEVARSIGTPVNTIKTRMHYARNRMAELLVEAGIDRAWVSI